MELLQLVNSYPILAPVIYILCYIVIVAISFPVASFITMAGGFLFGQPLSTIYVVFSATIGASIIFLAARHAFGTILKKKLGRFYDRFERGFQKNGIFYLLFLRLIPFFPFWVVNIAPAFVNVRFITYLWTTFVGIIPGSFINTQIGTGFGTMFDEYESFNIKALFNWQIRIALIALALFALLPILIRKWIKRNDR